MTTVYDMTWTMVEDNVRDIVASAEPPTMGLIAIARGGVIPAAMLLQHWKGLQIVTRGFSRYDIHNIPGAPRSTDSIIQLGMGDGLGWYIVDDVVDEGDTMAYLKAIYPQAKTLAICHKGKGLPPDMYAFELHRDMWVKFPWELS